MNKIHQWAKEGGCCRRKRIPLSPASNGSPVRRWKQVPGGATWTPKLADPELASSEPRIQKHASPHTGFMIIKADANCSRAPRGAEKSPRQAGSWVLYTLAGGRPGHPAPLAPRPRPRGRAAEALGERDLRAQKLGAVSAAAWAASFAFAPTALTGGFSVPRTIEGCTSPLGR